MILRFGAGFLGLAMLLSAAQAVSAESFDYSIEDANGRYGNATHVLKAAVEGRGVYDYQAFWQVDEGEWHWMNSNGDHRRSFISVENWNWRGSGPYKITFIFRKNDNKTILGKKTLELYTDEEPLAEEDDRKKDSSKQDEKSEIPTVEEKEEAAVGEVEPAQVSTRVSSSEFFADPNSPAYKQYEAWKNSRPSDALIMKKMSEVPTAKWLGGWNKDVKSDVAKVVSEANSAGKTPVFIAYNIPYRDCGGYSAGGVSGASNYRSWIDSIRAGIGSGKALVVLEPDALTGMDCLSDSRKSERLSLLSYAVSTLKKNPGTEVYIDSGHSNWKSAATMAERLKQAGVSKADGFALNVSNFQTTDNSVAYGKAISQAIGSQTHFIVDTSRNGNGPTSSSEWCNPSGRALGQKTTTNTGESLVDAFIWLKTPGESDGNCNGGPSAGVWWPEYALGLAKRAGW